MVAVLLVDVGLAIYILPKDPAMDLFIYSDGVQVDFTIGEKMVPKTVLKSSLFLIAVLLRRCDYAAYRVTN